MEALSHSLETDVSLSERLYHFIRSLMPMREASFQAALPFFALCSLAKSEFFHQSGRVCVQAAFLVEGALRSFFDYDGEERTHYIVLKNQAFTAFSSFISQKPSEENIQAIRASKLLVISRQHLYALYENYPEWQKLGRLIVEQNHLRMERRLLALMGETAEQRYRALCLQHPEMIRQVPLQYIASILGVNPATLSRIRKKMQN